MASSSSTWGRKDMGSLKRNSVPKALRERLGEQATSAFIDVWNMQQMEMTDDIVRAVVRELEPRFAAIEARLDRCATKDDLRRFATKDDFARSATKDDLAGFATKDDFGAFARKDDLRRFATKDDLRGFATQDRLDRLDEKVDRNAERFDRKFELMLEKMEVLRVDMADGFGRMRADMAMQRAELLRWMFIFWVGQAFVVLAYFRAGQYLASG